jgi:hypothetical protein
MTDQLTDQLFSKGVAVRPCLLIMTAHRDFRGLDGWSFVCLHNLWRSQAGSHKRPLWGKMAAISVKRLEGKA